MAVASECHLLKKVICKTWNGTLANSADLDQMQMNTVSGLHCLLKLQEVKG